MKFEKFLEELKSKTFEELAKGTNVECINNEVYEDDDLYNFLMDMETEIEDFGVGYVTLNANGKVYEIPYENRENRFGDDLPNETVLFFDYKRIYDVTMAY